MSKTSILKEGENCWRIPIANRAAVLVDAATYFGAVRRTLLNAQHSVFIAGWDIDSRTRLQGTEGIDDGAPATLGAFLAYLVERRPQLAIHLLLWDYSVLYALEREPLPTLNLSWTTPPQIKVCLDDVLPLGASHHQKIAVVDDNVAFCGGLDLTIRRWDTSDHTIDHPDRIDPGGKPYKPFHDIQMAVDGAAASALSELVRERWRDAACEDLKVPQERVADCWPDDLEPDFYDVAVGVARTLPATHWRREVREVELLYMGAIAAAERFIYIENQFLTAAGIADALVKRLRDNADLQVVIVAPKDHDGWIEARSMKTGRIRFMRRFESAGVLSRVRLLYPWVANEENEADVMVHAKLLVVDNTILRIGSANLNRRSMGLDTECDLAIEARDDHDAAAIEKVRNSLIAEHLGVDPESVLEAVERLGSIFAAIDELGGHLRGLRAIEDEPVYEDGMSQTIGEFADLERPIHAERFVGDMFGGRPTERPFNRNLKMGLFAIAIIALALAWRYSGLAAWADVSQLVPWFDRLADQYWAPLTIPLVYVIGGLVVFPVTVLIALTAMTFGPAEGLAYAFVGSLLSATVTYGLGAALGRGLLQRAFGRRLNKISRSLGKTGILSVAAVRMVPIAPFTFINLVAGASHIKFRDYVIGTVMGMLPGMALMTVFGYQMGQLLKDPVASEVGLFVLIVVLWLFISLALQMLVARFSKRSE